MARKKTAAVLALLSIAVCGGAPNAQSQRATGQSVQAGAKESSDEVVVHGKRLGELRVQVQVAREHAFQIFNEINSDDDFDVRCADEVRTFSHATKHVCRARFESRIAAQAGSDYFEGLIMACNGPGGVTQDCMFSAAGERGVTRAQRAENPLQGKQQQMKEEIRRLANEDERFAQAILDYYEASQELKAATKRRGDE
jgi:hypothetical protein